MLRTPCLVALLAALALTLSLAARASARNGAMFTFGEMVDLQAATLRADAEPDAMDEILFKNLEFYAFTVFETLHAVNNAAVMRDEAPLFCAPTGVFTFEQDGEISRLAAFLAQELMHATDALGADPSRYDDKPASEALLLGLRTAFPCDAGEHTLSAMR